MLLILHATVKIFINYSVVRCDTKAEDGAIVPETIFSMISG